MAGKGKPSAGSSLSGKAKTSSRSSTVDALVDKPVTGVNKLHYNEINSESVNANVALNDKLSNLQTAQQKAVKVRELPDGRIRYYRAEKVASNPGLTRGSSYVTEYNPKTGQVSSWYESYDHSGKVIRVHPKLKEGLQLEGQHYPPTGKEIGAWSKKR